MRPSKISKELVGAVAEEQKRQSIDAAKKKAVEQLADYDTFKKMVSVAHLKPIQARGAHVATASCLPAWQLDPRHLTSSSAYDATSQHQHAASSSEDQVQHQQRPPAQEPAAAPVRQAFVLPRTRQEFARDWRRSCPTAEAKYMLLRQCGAQGLAQIFKVEVDGPLLGQLLQVLQQQWLTQAHASQQQGPPAAPPELQPPQQQQQQQQQEAGGALSAAHEAPDALLRCTAAAAAAVQENLVVVTEAVLVVQMLKSLAGTGRFDLNVRLMDKPSKAAAAELCRQLQAVLQQQQQQQGLSGPAGGSSCAGQVAADCGSHGNSAASHALSSSSSEQEVQQSHSSCTSELASVQDALQDLQQVLHKLRL